MKNLMLLFLALTTMCAVAQQTQYPMPDFDNVPYYYNEQTNTLETLEKANYKIESKAKGLWGAGLYVVIPGNASKTRYSTNQKLQLLIHADDTRTDPSTLFQLVALTINQKNNNNQREYLLKSQGAGHSETNSEQVSVNFKKVGDGLYLVTFADATAKGEYAFSIEKTRQAYTFGID